MNKKLFLAVISSFLLTSAFAQDKNQDNFKPDLYLGIQGGLAYDGLPNHKNINNLVNLKKDEAINLAGRIFAGYNFTKHFALEGGFLLTDKTEVKALDFDKHMLAKFTIKQQIIDLTPRINIPLDNKFTLYGRAGVAFIDAFNSGKDKRSYNLTYGAGLDYNITTNLVAGVSWAHYNGGSTKPIDIIYKKYEPSLNFYSLSIFYKFGV